MKQRIRYIETFLTDRATSQIDAIKKAWPETDIIFCAIHIGRNLKANVGVEMLHYYDRMQNWIITEEKLLTEFRNYITDHQNDKDHTNGVKQEEIVWSQVLAIRKMLQSLQAEFVKFFIG